MSKRPAPLSPTSLRDELASAGAPDPSALVRDIGTYLEALSPTEKTSPLSLLLGTCVLQLRDIMARSTVSIEDAIERDKRERSVVVQGLVESCAVKASERVAEDLAKVTAMLDLAELEHSPATVFRMGEKSDSRPRLLKVMFHSRSAQLSLIKKSRLITSHYPNVYVRPSMTKAEREKEYKLRQECRHLRGQGKEVVVYAGSIIEKSQLAEVQRRMRASHSRPTSTPISSIPPRQTTILNPKNQ
ncbi:hypothetical protein DXG03_007996 [Asterophora parasitica]|uniref:Uncharacterized protein n=1 Tax=Asterophora parasitica TaxID=117018 RepID=A0A9P7K952_9AGAR|nr:hypothetical protein DXG03_007996 [Asterophora parasitica]